MSFYKQGQRQILTETPFQISNNIKLKVSIDYIKTMWDNPFTKPWRKKNNINTIEDYIKYTQFFYE